YPTDLYPLSLHDALPILRGWRRRVGLKQRLQERLRTFQRLRAARGLERFPVLAPSGNPCDSVERTARLALCDSDPAATPPERQRSEEHTSELQSRENLVC